MTDYNQLSLKLHREKRGKLSIVSKVELNNSHDLSLVYTPGVAAVCEAVAEHPAQAYDLTIKGNSVAIISDGSAVLGLGNIGAEGALPVMEGKAVLFKTFADIDGFPLVLSTQDTEEIISTVRAIAPTFGGINLEDIAAPACFEIENHLQDLGIPVFHDDQHGTAIVLLAALDNACKVIGKPIEETKVVINGAGAAGIAIAKLLRCVGHNTDRCVPAKAVLVCDSKGIIHKGREDINCYKKELLHHTNLNDQQGSLQDALKDADVFIGVSRGNILNEEDIKSMAKDPIVLAMANPIPEIMPDIALKAGATIVGTGRSDFPNQVNNVLAFPGIFRGALDAKATCITTGMKMAAIHALAAVVTNPQADKILPDPLDKSVAKKVAEAVCKQAIEEGVCRET